MERLTERNTLGEALLKAELNERYEPLELIDVLLNRLAAYEDTGLEPEGIRELLHDSTGPLHKKLGTWIDAEQDSRLMVLPCKVGDTVYRLWPCGKHGKGVSKMVVKHIDIDFLPEIEFYCRKETGGGNFWFFKVPDIGKTVFLTRKEAEKALGG